MKVISREFTPDEGLIGFLVKVDGGSAENVAPVAVNGNVRLEYEVTDIPVGNHTIRLGADNGWEVTWDVPFDLTRPQPIATPFGLGLER